MTQAERFGAKFHTCDIKHVDIGCRPFRVECAETLEEDENEEENENKEDEIGKKMNYKTKKLGVKTVIKSFTSSAIIIATGATAKWLNVKGESELLSKGIHTCATCDGFFYKGKHAAVIGGGDTAMEQVLTSFSRRYYFVVKKVTRKKKKKLYNYLAYSPSIALLFFTLSLLLTASLQ